MSMTTPDRTNRSFWMVMPYIESRDGARGWYHAKHSVVIGIFIMELWLVGLIGIPFSHLMSDIYATFVLI